MTYNNENKYENFPKVTLGKDGKYQVTDYCSQCPNQGKCKDYSFINIMYSKTPSILALSQLSINKLQELGISEAEYMRLISYNIRYISMMEDIYAFYRKILQSMQIAQFKFDVKAYMIIDELFNLLIKWFEKIILWNRINSIKLKTCVYYKELLSENIDFIFDLAKENISNGTFNIVNVINIDELKCKFKEAILTVDRPKTNGDYFNHTQIIKQKLMVLLECISFSILSYFRSIQTESIYIYVAPSMVTPEFNEACKKLIKDMVKYLKERFNINQVTIKPVTKNIQVHSEIALLISNYLQKEFNHELVISVT